VYYISEQACAQRENQHSQLYVLTEQYVQVLTVWCSSCVVLKTKYIPCLLCVCQVSYGNLVQLTLKLGYTTCCKGEFDNINNCQQNYNLVKLAKQIYLFHSDSTWQKRSDWVLWIKNFIYKIMHSNNHFVTKNNFCFYSLKWQTFIWCRETWKKEIIFLH